MRQITFAPTPSAWQQAARRALAEGLLPEEVAWEERGSDQPSLALFGESQDVSALPAPARSFTVPRDFLAMMKRVAHHSDPRRWGLLYGVLWRLTHGEPRLLDIVVDPAVHELMRMDKAVRHDVHKMRAFVRFREVRQEDCPWFIAWFEPEHHIVELNAPFFRDRFAQMRWSILTPRRCVHWDGAELSFTGGVPKPDTSTDDGVEALWLTYYGSIFNPARVKLQAMQSEMPKRYWKNLPEAKVIPALLNSAEERVATMRQASAAKVMTEDALQEATPPDTENWETLREAAAQCQACPLWRNATRTVFGEGPVHAPLMIVGEQPGDQEDLAGRPFVGPAGKLLDRALRDAGIAREKAYVTNAVKHFKWEPRGKRRLHSKPGKNEVAACKPWLAAELRVLKPKVLLLLGSTAAASVLGHEVRVLRDRGKVIVSPYCERTLITVHPSSLLRAPTDAARESGYAAFVEDLRTLAKLL